MDKLQMDLAEAMGGVTPKARAEFLIRMLDVWTSIVAIVLLLPIMVIVAALIKFTSAGPVFFVQTRQGINGEWFDIYKFRSMKVEPASDVVVQAKRNDSRVTAVGKIIRKTSLDEIPQFFNVLKGDMSVVGPRPHAMQHNEFYEKKIERYKLRYLVKPGITGWAQICGSRGETETIEKMERRIDLDLWYIENRTFWLDVKIIFLTVLVALKFKDAY